MPLPTRAGSLSRPSPRPGHSVTDLAPAAPLPPAPGPSPEEAIRLVREAIQRRERWAGADHPVRLFDRSADGITRLVIERYGTALRASGSPDRARLLPAIREALGNPRELFFRFGFETLGGPEGDDGVRRVREDGLEYEVQLLPHRNTGLFLEAQPARAWVRANASGRRILNLFAYTCAFGVAAAAGGARSTVNVDAVPTVLARGRRNYELNRAAFDTRCFWEEDVLDALKRSRRSKAAFEGLILHPPPVATGGTRGRRTDPRDLARLAQGSRAVLAPGAWLLVPYSPEALTRDEVIEAVGLGAPTWEAPPRDDFGDTPGQPAPRALAFAGGARTLPRTGGG